VVEESLDGGGMREHPSPPTRERATSWVCSLSSHPGPLPSKALPCLVVHHAVATLKFLLFKQVALYSEES
jgi:hypothetical protein